MSYKKAELSHGNRMINHVLPKHKDSDCHSHLLLKSGCECETINK